METNLCGGKKREIIFDIWSERAVEFVAGSLNTKTGDIDGIDQKSVVCMFFCCVCDWEWLFDDQICFPDSVDFLNEKGFEDWRIFSVAEIEHQPPNHFLPAARLVLNYFAVISFSSSSNGFTFCWNSLKFIYNLLVELT